MNKERLEELKKMRLLYEVCFVDEYASAIDDVTADFDLLIKRVQELEDIIYQDARQGVIEGLYEENKRYREALEEITTRKMSTFLTTREMNIHFIKTARKALESESND